MLKSLNYQGRVTVNGVNFDGTGQFRFELVNETGTVTYWSSGTGTVAVPVTKGAYSVLLGDAGMNPVPYSVFHNKDVRLRVWFNDGVHGLLQMSPDQRIASVGYAMAAAHATELHNTSGSTSWDVDVWDTLNIQGEQIAKPLIVSTSGTRVGAFGLRPNDEGTVFAVEKLASDDIESAFADFGSTWTGELTVESSVYVGGSIDSKGSIQLEGNLDAGDMIHCDFLRVRSNGMEVFGGAVFQDNVNINKDVYCQGSLAVSGTKNFVQPHATDATKEIVYTCLEGPEAGTYVRGSATLVNGVAEVPIPEHFGMVTATEGLTAQLTPRGGWLQLYVESVTPAHMVVREANGQSGNFDYLVQGVRKGYEEAPVIRDRTMPGKEEK